MACFESMAARRILLWYILLGSFVILPLTFDLTLGCKFMVVGMDDTARKEYQGFGVFNSAVYDPSNQGTFLGCADFSMYWTEQTNDISFRASRYAGGFLLGFVSLASLINICLQCFNKHGKSGLWSVMRMSYLGATAAQGGMYALFSSDVCSTIEGQETQCWLGRNGVAGVFNFVLLFAMVIATFNSYPPRNPVFQCWTGVHDNDSSSGSYTDGEDDVDVESANNDASSNHESVSLFGNSRAGSRRSKKSTKSSKSDNKDVVTDRSIKKNATEEDDNMSAAEQGSKRKETAVVISSLADDEKDNVSLAGSIRNSIANKIFGFKGKKKSTATIPAVEHESSFRGVADRVQQIETGIYLGNGAREVKPQLQTPASAITGVSGLTTPHHTVSDDEVVKAKRYDQDNDDNDSIKFLRDLAAVTKLGKGGIRVKTVEKDHLVEIVDEYPSKAGEGLNAPHDNDGADLVKVRTEYYDQGSRTTKEITHHDGSRTVVTTINSLVTNDSMSTNNAKESGKKGPAEVQAIGSIEAQGQTSKPIVHADSRKSNNKSVSLEQKSHSYTAQRSTGKTETSESLEARQTKKSDQKTSSKPSRSSKSRSTKPSKRDKTLQNGLSF